MNPIEDRLTALETQLRATETRLRVAEDQLEIMRLLNSYGPLVDSGMSQQAAHLWVENGVYDIAGLRRMIAYDDLATLYDGEGHQAMIHAGCSHVTSPARITVKGDEAEAVAYSQVITKQGDGWIVWRASVNYWQLVRTPEGWRIVERYNRIINGSKDCHDTMRRVLVSGQLR